jgi:hypothetical protein
MTQVGSCCGTDRSQEFQGYVCAPSGGQQGSTCGNKPPICRHDFFGRTECHSKLILERPAGLGRSTLNAAACAVVVHLTPHRIRIKIPGWERRDADFAALQDKLEMCPGVTHVHVNALVASVVIRCSDGFQIVSARLCFTGLELALPVSADRTWQIASPKHVSGQLATLAVELAIAIWARRLEGLIIEWILQAAVRALLRRPHRSPAPLPQLEAPRPLLAAAAA